MAPSDTNHASVTCPRSHSNSISISRIALGSVSSTPHPDGFIKLDLAFSGSRCRGRVELPAAITGVFVWHGKEQTLSGGANTIDLSP